MPNLTHAPAASDADLAQRIALGDTGAFTLLIRRHQGPVFGFLGRLGLTPALAEEVAQETFVRVWRSAGSYEPNRAAFSTWLYTIARRLALNELERAEHRLRVHPAARESQALEPDEALYADRPSETPSPLEQIDSARRQASLQAAIRQLPMAERSLLALAYQHELSLADVARIEGLTEAAAKARLHRARQRLRELLQLPQPPPPTEFV